MPVQYEMWFIAAGLVFALYLLWVACKHINANWNGPTTPEEDPEAQYNEYIAKTYGTGTLTQEQIDSIRWEG